MRCRRFSRAQYRNTFDYLESVHVKYRNFERFAGACTDIGAYTQQPARRTYHGTRTKMRLTPGGYLFDNTLFGKVNDSVDIVLVGGDYQVTTIRREKGVVQVPAHVGYFGDRHVWHIQIHDPYLTGLLERDHEEICEGGSGDHARVCLDHLSVRIDAAQRY